MSDGLPAAIRVRELPGGVRYVLPRGKGKAALVLGLILLVPALMFAVPGIVGVLLVVWMGMQPAGIGFSLPLLVIPIIVTLAIAVPVVLYALWLIVGHTVVELVDGMLRRTHMLGPLPLGTRSALSRPPTSWASSPTAGTIGPNWWRPGTIARRFCSHRCIPTTGSGTSPTTWRCAATLRGPRRR